jgi:hypothetical protein
MAIRKIFRVGSTALTCTTVTRSCSRSMSSSMKGWQLNDYSGIEALNFKEDLKIPTIQTPTDVLIKVEVCLFVCLFVCL